MAVNRRLALTVLDGASGHTIAGTVTVTLPDGTLAALTDPVTNGAVLNPAAIPGAGFAVIAHDPGDIGAFALTFEAPGHMAATAGVSAGTDDADIQAELELLPTGGSSGIEDIAVMGPRVRRAVEGPTGPPPGITALSDDQVTAITADALADAILLSGGLFGHQLIVSARDAVGGFPTAWKTEKPLDEWEVSVVACQAALTYFFHQMLDKKTSETLTNEGQTWTYELSANLLTAQIKLLQDQRDQAMKALRLMHPTLDRFASILAVRDVQTQSVLEWYTRVNPENWGIGAGGLGGGQEAAVIPAFFGP